MYTRNNVRTKFDPEFGPELHKVVEVRGNGTILLRVCDSKIIRRHLDDVKDATAVAASAHEDTWWVDSEPVAPLPHTVPAQALDHRVPEPLMNSGWCGVDERNILPNRRRGGDVEPSN